MAKVKKKPTYKNGGKVGDPKKKEAMKLIALNEADFDNNLGDYFRAGEMSKADSVRKVMMDRFNRIVELGYGKLAEDSLPYNSLTSMNAYTELVQKQNEEERGKKAPMGPFPRGVDTDGVKEKGRVRVRMKKGGKVKFNKKYTAGSSNVAKRKKLMKQISDIYKKYRGTKQQRKKKGFPPAVEARLKKLMAQRDKI